MAWLAAIVDASLDLLAVALPAPAAVPIVLGKTHGGAATDARVVAAETGVEADATLAAATEGATAEEIATVAFTAAGP